MAVRPIDANALKRYFSDEQMKCVSVDELDYTLNALTYDVLESVIEAIDNAPTMGVKEKG